MSDIRNKIKEIISNATYELTLLVVSSTNMMYTHDNIMYGKKYKTFITGNVKSRSSEIDYIINECLEYNLPLVIKTVQEMNGLTWEQTMYFLYDGEFQKFKDGLSGIVLTSEMKENIKLYNILRMT